MDPVKARKVLASWEQEVIRLRADRDWTAENDAVLALLGREDQVSRVLQRVQGHQSRPQLTSRIDLGGSPPEYDFFSTLPQIRFAIGKLDTDAETAEILGSSAPQMAADSMHRLIWDAAAELWGNGHYSEAVQRAGTQLNAEITFKTNRRDIADTQLMAQAFSPNPPEPGKSRLRWPGDDRDQTVKSMRAGILQYAQGVFMAIRNPSTHNTKPMEPQVALEQLAALSTLARWVDVCEVLSIDE